MIELIRDMLKIILGRKSLTDKRSRDSFRLQVKCDIEETKTVTEQVKRGNFMENELYPERWR